jgi:tRNA-splicing ligase RtcB
MSMSGQDRIHLEKIDDFRWRIPRTGGMRVDGVIYTSEEMLRDLNRDESPKQVANVAHLPGIQKYSLAMPDIHWGYGFPIGGVAAFDWKEGVVSPGGVGYDINCGTRLPEPSRQVAGRSGIWPTPCSPNSVGRGLQESRG